MAQPEGYFFLSQWLELLSHSTVDIWGQIIPSCSIPGLYPPDVFSTSSSERTNSVFRKCQMSPGGLTCTPNSISWEPLLYIMKKYNILLQPTIWLGKTYMPETKSACRSIYLHLYLSQSTYLSICLPFSSISPFASVSSVSQKVLARPTSLILWFHHPASLMLLWWHANFPQVCWSVQVVLHLS